MLLSLAVLGVPLLVVVAMLVRAVHVVPESQRLAISRLGRFSGIGGPGLVVVVPFVDSYVRYDLGHQELRCPDTEGVDALVRYQILDAEKVHVGCASLPDALRQCASTALKKVKGSRPGKAPTDAFARQAARDAMDELTQALGVKVLEIDLQPRA
jgi:regulator of protease activity HflC (stomatin/prohibitin superfamily)